MSDYSEQLVEQAAIELFAQLGYQTINCLAETHGPFGTLGRETRHDVVLLPQLRAALERLNPTLPPTAIDAALEEIARDRSAMHPVHANQDVWKLLHDGVKIDVRDERGNETTETVRVIDWNDPASNDLLLTSQLWISGETYTRRPDLVGFVNGLPLILVEFKSVTKPLRNAFDDNLRDYKETIPQLFWYNGLVILSNGTHSRLGTITSAWEHFAEWKRVADEDEPPAVSLETMIRGTCEPNRLLDLVENFTLFTDVAGKPVKILGKNHQVLGVNRAFSALDQLGDNPGKLGVFWHTQGAGKSFSMIFFSRKVLRKRPGSPTFVIVTDRKELDSQIYRNFLDSGTVTEQDEAYAESGQHLKQLLAEDHRYVFTLIQKFRTDKRKFYPRLSDRSDIIVMTDEAHRSQYDDLATNMRTALPNAAFIAFTGTPLIAGEERTREVFGDYVSVYNFRDSIEDGATVPLYYENRVPEMQLVNDTFNAELEAIIDNAMLDDAQEKRLEREFAREYHLITDDDRLERIAADIVDHYLGRYRANGNLTGKAMVVSVDKATTVRMYDKVHRIWQQRIAELEQKPLTPSQRGKGFGDWGEEDPGVRAEQPDPETSSPLTQEFIPTKEGPGGKGPGDWGLNAELDFLQSTDMAVVVSSAQNEVADFDAKGLDIRPHRKRMIEEDLADRFKDPDDPFRIVFVTAMWMTGFDVPSLSTIYLDKPLRNHTLMQTIARANRVFGGKVNGLIVDYVGIFRNLEKALAIYAAGPGDGDTPIKPKEELVAKLRDARDKALAFLENRGVDVLAIQNASAFARIGLLQEAREVVLETDASRVEFLTLVATADTFYRAVQPDPVVVEFRGDVALLDAIAGMIRALQPKVDISGVMAQVEDLLERSLAAEGYVIQETSEEDLIDLSQLDFGMLAARFAKGRQHTESQRLRAAIERKIAQLIDLNKSRIDYADRLQEVVDAYNAGSINVQAYFQALLDLAQDLGEEEQRHIALGLSEEELALFDVITRPGPDLTPAEEEQVKKAARGLLATLKKSKLVLDWRKKQQSKAAVRQSIQRGLRTNLPGPYTRDLVIAKQEEVYQHIYERYPDATHGVYANLFADYPSPG